MSTYQELISQEVDPSQDVASRRMRSAKLVRLVLDHFGGNQSSLAREMGVAANSVSLWTRGTEPKAHHWAKMAHYAGLTPEQALAYIAGQPLQAPKDLDQILREISLMAHKDLAQVLRAVSDRYLFLSSL